MDNLPIPASSLFVISLLTLISWRLRLVSCAAYLVTATWLLLAPGNRVETHWPAFPGLDKILHFALFGGLVLCARLAVHHPERRTLSTRFVLPLAILYGIATESAQAILVRYHRTFEWADLLANISGALVFWWLANRLLQSRPSVPPDPV